MTAPFAMRSPIEFRMTVMCSTGRPNMVSSGPCWLSQRPTVYAQGGAISSPRTAETDQPTVRMSSATARMQASGSRSMPPACASHSAHLHRWSAGLARRLRDGFISDTLRGGYDIFGLLSGRRTGPVLRARPVPVLRVRPGPGLPRRGDAEMPLDRAQPALDLLQQAVDGVGQLAAPLPRWRRGERRAERLLRLVLDLRDHPRPQHRRVRAECAEDPGGRAVLDAGQPEQQVPGADVVVAELERFSQRELQAPLGPPGE